MTIRYDTVRGRPWFVVDGEEAAQVYRMASHIPGVRARRNTMRIPADPRLLELIFRGQSPKMDAKVYGWYTRQRKQEEYLEELIAQGDCSVVHPRAERLWPFQRVGVDFIRRAGNCLLADECGLGKTATTIVSTETARRFDRILCVCPNALKRWWANEVKTWSAYDPPTMVVDSPQRQRLIEEYERGWFIINYEQLRLAPELASMSWDWIIYDEAHRLKNRRTQTFQAAKELRARRVLELTGTPVGNNPAELWSLLHLLRPGRYASYWRFFEMYVKYKEDYFGREILGTLNSDLLRRELATVMVRREKEQVLADLPDKVYQTIPLELTTEQTKFYRQMARDMLLELEDRVLTAPNVITMILRLRQISSTLANFDLPDDSCKLDAVMDILDANPSKLVVFTQFRKTVQALCNRLAKANIEFQSIMGGLGTDEIARRVEYFQGTRECRVMVGTAATGGVGLTLTSSPTVVFVDKHWNPIQQAQAEDRVHRIGQKETVHIITLHCPRTADELVEAVLAKKLRMQSEILQTALAEHLEQVS